MSGQPHHAYTEPDNEWRELALCKGKNPNDFYPEATSNKGKAKHKAIAVPVQVANTCGLCPVASDCLRAGLHDDNGVWGGTTGYERRWIRSLLRGTRIMDQRRPNDQRRPVVLGMAIRAGLLGGGE